MDGDDKPQFERQMHTDNAPLVVALSDLTECDDQPDLVGGKAANLVELIKLARGGFEVLPGFCVTSAAFLRHLVDNGLAADYERFEAAFRRMAMLRGQRDGDARLMKKQQRAAEQELLRLRERLRAEVESVPLPESVLSAIAAEFRRLQAVCGEGSLSVAVRSSGLAEDLPGASFAGQYDTFLNQRGLNQISKSVRRCFASNFGERVALYKLELHATKLMAQRAPALEEIRYGAMAVVVQQMADAHAAGVGLSADPATREEVCYINANYGLGETVVQGRVTPDTWRIDPDDGRLLDKRIGAKEEVVTAARQGGLRSRRVSQTDRASFCLPDALVSKLAAEMERLKTHYRSAKGIAEIDVEFVIDRQGRLYLVQVRADTTPGASLYDIPEEALRTARVIFKGGVSGNGGAVASRALVADGDPHVDDTVTRALKRMRAGDIIVAREMVLTWMCWTLT